MMWRPLLLCLVLGCSNGDDGGTAAPDSDAGCVPDCEGRACGDDGCGSSCGACSIREECTAGGQCVCKPDCILKECGDDGCGGTCGTCPAHGLCAAGECLCEHVSCGDACCPEGDRCSEGACCTPDCAGKTCAPDGCGDACGECPDAAPICFMDACCAPDCPDDRCELPDGCGGACPDCPPAAAPGLPSR